MILMIIGREFIDPTPSQEEFGKMLGVSKNTVWAWENGKFNPSLEMAFKIKNLLSEKSDMPLKIEDIFIDVIT